MQSIYRHKEIIGPVLTFKNLGQGELGPCLEDVEDAFTEVVNAYIDNWPSEV